MPISTVTTVASRLTSRNDSEYQLSSADLRRQRMSSVDLPTTNSAAVVQHDAISAVEVVHARCDSGKR